MFARSLIVNGLPPRLRAATALAAVTLSALPRMPCASILSQCRTATKKSGGSSSNGRTSQPKNLGIKRHGGALVKPSEIILRQRGRAWHAGPGVVVGKDHTLHAARDGVVTFRYDLETARRIVTVVDGTGDEAPVVGHGSKKSAKRLLVDAIDAEKYVPLSSLERYKYVREVRAEIVKKDGEERLRRLERRLEGTARSKFDLVDLTLV